ncbi:MAG: DUF3667 domain-containing protein, partial [Bacteroidota bacterium]
MATHFLHDLTHFDGKFFSTLKYLLFKPAYLSKEYLKGRRTSYLHPIRMYLFTSFIFFLIFFNFYQNEENLKINEDKKPVAADIKKLKDKSENNTEVLFGGINNDSLKANSIVQYDSLEKTLPDSQKDKFFRTRFIHLWFHLKEKFKNDEKAMWRAVLERFLHMFPQMLFVSLPFFALILQLLYVRRKQIYYVNHVVFTFHLYCGTFILILATLLLGSLFKAFHLSIVTFE